MMNIVTTKQEMLIEEKVLLIHSSPKKQSEGVRFC